MKVKLSVITGPHQGREFEFDGRDTFLVGRSADAHLLLPQGDPYFSRRHFLLEVNPPRCRLTDLNSRNGTKLNGSVVQSAEVADGDEISAGHTSFRVGIQGEGPDAVWTLSLPGDPSRTTDHFPATASFTHHHVESLIPGYRLEKEIGRGGMGGVCRAIREKDGLPVAVKTILPAAGTSDKQIERFLRECDILGKLAHPNIVSFLGSGSSNGLVYLVMELMDGPDLAARVKAEGPYDVRTAVRITCQMLAGLAEAHARGFVHRDIKPSNVLLGASGVKKIAKLADFGLARVYEATRISGLTVQGDIGGTPAFMAPEQVTHYRVVRPAADQYSAAATLYYLLTGAFTHDLPKSLTAQIAHIVTVPPTPIIARRPDVPAGLAAVIHKALSRESEDRYADIAEFRKELKKFA